MRQKLGGLLCVGLLLSACASSGAEGLGVQQLETSGITTDDGHAAQEDRYEVTMFEKTYVLASDAWLSDEDGALRQFYDEHEAGLDRIGSITGMSELSDSNAEDYAAKVTPIITATEHEGQAITEQERADARAILSMCFLLAGDEKVQGLRDALADIEGMDPASDAFASHIERLSEYLPVLAADNGQFVRDAWDISLKRGSDGT
ncbi:hypothetical protein [Trueperella pyogenes]